jgi:hypothetical protein
MVSVKKPSPQPRLDLRVIVYPHHRLWIAHCLEMDVAAEGTTPAEAVDTLIALCDLQIRSALDDADLPSIFRPAPAEFWHMFAMAARTRHAAPPERIDRLEVRELATR